jgi:hypothetical protein
MVGGHIYSARQSIVFNGKDVYDTLARKWSPAEGLNEVAFWGSKGNILTGLAEAAGLKDSATFRRKHDDALTASSAIERGDLGVNLPLSRNMDLEVSGGAARIKYQSFNANADEETVEAKYSGFLSARLFSTLAVINGELVPAFSVSQIKVGDLKLQRGDVGIGANVTLDRGFFWVGIQAKYSQRFDDTVQSKSLMQIPVSFGIERNIVWDWFVMRVGAQMTLWGKETGGTLEYNYQFPDANGTINDKVGFGVGLNLEEKLKIDGVVAEDIFYTFGNLISGNVHHILSRITATYSF